MKVTVFAGARGGAELMSDNRIIGAELAKRGCTVYYGGSRKGVMGAVADGFKRYCDDHGPSPSYSDMIGVLPETIASLKHYDPDLGLVVTRDMASRKQVFWDNSDAFLCLAGGWGTLDELTEILTEMKLNHRPRKPVVVFDQGGFFRPLRDMIKNMEWFGTATAEKTGLVRFETNPIEAVNALVGYGSVLEQGRETD